MHLPFHGGRKQGHDNSDQLILSEAAQIRAAQEAAIVDRLTVGRTTIKERLQILLGDRQSKNISLQGLKRVVLHRTPIDFGGVLVNELPTADLPIERINFDVADDNSQLTIVSHRGRQTVEYKFLQPNDGIIRFESGDMRLSLINPLAAEGLQRLEYLCNELGDLCLSNTQA